VRKHVAPILHPTIRTAGKLRTFIPGCRLTWAGKSDKLFGSRVALLVFVTILLLQLALVIGTPKGISWDPSYGMLAAQQHLVGLSPDIFALAKAKPDDLTKIFIEPVPNWAPGYQAIPYALRSITSDWGFAVRLTLGLVLVVGAVGWLAYFSEVLGSPRLGLWLSSIVALTRFRWTMALTYDGGDQLAWAVSPWLFVMLAAALQSAEHHSQARAAVLSAMAGVTGASLFALKYSAIFVAIGAATAFCVICLRRRYWQMALLMGACFLAAMGVIKWAGFPQATIVTAAMHGQVEILRALASLGLPTIGVTDLDPLIRAVCQKTVLDSELTGALIGGVIGLAIAIAVGMYGWRLSPFAEGNRLLVYLALGAFAANLAIVFFLMLGGANMSLDGRFGRISALLLLPILVAAWGGMLYERRSIWKVCAVGSAFIILILPTVAATARQLPNIVDRLDHAALETDRGGLFNPYVSPRTDVKALYAEIESIAPNSVLYTIYAQMAFPLAQRSLIIVEAEEWQTPATLSRFRYLGRPSSGVALLLPDTFERNGKLEAIKRSFVDIPNFLSHKLLADPKWALWVSQD
jgi:hypothetical protein